MTIKRIDHVAIVVDDLESALAVYRDTLGMSFSHIDTIPEQGVRVGFYRQAIRKLNFSSRSIPSPVSGSTYPSAAKASITSVSK